MHIGEVNRRTKIADWTDYLWAFCSVIRYMLLSKKQEWTHYNDAEDDYVQDDWPSPASLSNL